MKTDITDIIKYPTRPAEDREKLLLVNFLNAECSESPPMHGWHTFDKLQSLVAPPPPIQQMLDEFNSRFPNRAWMNAEILLYIASVVFDPSAQLLWLHTIACRGMEWVNENSRPFTLLELMRPLVKGNDLILPTDEAYITAWAEQRDADGVTNRLATPEAWEQFKPLLNFMAAPKNASIN